MAKGTLHRVAAVKLESGDRVLVTGASGFIGSAVTRHLVAREQEVVALVEPGADAANLEELDVKQVVGDLRSAESVRKAVSGCRAVFHVAALYRFWARDPSAFYDDQRRGDAQRPRAASEAGVERLVYTSTVGTLGLEQVLGIATRRTSALSPTSAICMAPTSARSTSPSTRCCAPSPRACLPRWCCRPFRSDPETGPRRRPASSCSTS